MARIDNIINVNSVWNSTTILPILESVTLKVWIYTGTQGNEAATNVALAADNSRLQEPTYTLKGSSVLSGTDKVVQFDIAPLIRDYVESELNQNHNSNNAVWVDLQSCNTINGEELIQASEHFLALDGYEYTMNTVGNQIDEPLRTSNRHLLNSEGEQVSYPVLRQEVQSYSWLEAGVAITEASPIDLSDSNESNEQVVYIISPDGDTPDRLTITYNDNSTEDITIEDICQGRYEHIKLTFVNRLGAFQDLYFFGNSRTTVNIKEDMWNRRNKVTGGGAYRPTAVKNITRLNERNTLNSGFYPESNNVVFEELIQSNNVWITKGIDTFPVLIKNSSLNLLDSNTNKAINYTIDFEYAFNKTRSL